MTLAQLKRFMKIVNHKYPEQAKALLLFGDGSGSIRVANHGRYNQAALTRLDDINARVTVVDWSPISMETKLYNYGCKLLEEQKKTNRSDDPYEELLLNLEAAIRD